MKLRDHPLMTRKSGVRSWPRYWTSTRPDISDKPIGEVGVLQQVLLNESMKTAIFLFIDFNGLRYMGSMRFDDAKFCSAISRVLKTHIGFRIEAIGGLDVSHTL